MTEQKLWNANTKITDEEIKSIVTQHEKLDQQIEILRKAKLDMILAHGITKSNFYARKKLLDNKNK